MEYMREATKKKNKNHCIRRIHDVFSDTSFSSSSESNLEPYKHKSPKTKSVANSKRDCLSRIFEKKKLKEKSLSKKMKTPLDRKLYRTCWPIKLHKVSRIKKKPQEKKKEKPSYKSIMQKKFLNPTLISEEMFSREHSPPITSSELEFLDDELFGKVYRLINKKRILFEQVTPEMLMKALLHPDHLKQGATLDMIVEKLRALKVDLNPSQKALREEILQKLLCAIKLGLVVESNGYYRISDDFLVGQCSKARFGSIWRMWLRRMTKLRSDS